MNELTVTTTNGVEVTDSRQVAELIGKEHSKLLRDIRTYCDYLNEANFGLVDFFLESSYIDGKGEERPCYLVTRKGCEMIANKLTGKKGTAFTATYINAFHSMEQHIEQSVATPTFTEDTKLLNARVRMANMYLKLSNVDTLSENYKSVLVAKAAQALSGEELLPLPKSEQKMYSATEIGEMFGVTAYKIGKIAKANNMKIAEYGEWYHSKSKYSTKEVDTFMYNDKAVEKFKELLK